MDDPVRVQIVVFGLLVPEGREGALTRSIPSRWTAAEQADGTIRDSTKLTRTHGATVRSIPCRQQGLRRHVVGALPLSLVIFHISHSTRSAPSVLFHFSSSSVQSPLTPPPSLSHVQFHRPNPPSPSSLEKRRIHSIGYPPRRATPKKNKKTLALIGPIYFYFKRKPNEKTGSLVFLVGLSIWAFHLSLSL